MTCCTPSETGYFGESRSHADQWASRRCQCFDLVLRMHAQDYVWMLLLQSFSSGIYRSPAVNVSQAVPKGRYAPPLIALTAECNCGPWCSAIRVCAPDLAEVRLDAYHTLNDVSATPNHDRVLQGGGYIYSNLGDI